MYIQDVLKKLKGEIVTVVSGEIISVGAISKGTGQYGAWTLQPATLKDSTGEIALTFGNCREIKKGEKICIRSVEGKHGWNGIKMDSYKDKPQLKVTETAKINNFEGETGKDTTPGPEVAKTAPQEPKYVPVDKEPKPDWDKKNRVEIRSKLWNSALMTLGPELMKKEWTEKMICEVCTKIVNEGTRVAYEEPEEIGF